MAPLGNFYQLMLTDHQQDDAIKDLYRKNGWTVHSIALSKQALKTLVQNGDKGIVSFIQSTNKQLDEMQADNQPADATTDTVEREFHEPVCIKREPECEALGEQNDLKSCEDTQLNNHPADCAAESMNTGDYVVVKTEVNDEALYINSQLEGETSSEQNDHESELELHVEAVSEPESDNDYEVESENTDSESIDSSDDNNCASDSETDFYTSEKVIDRQQNNSVANTSYLSQSSARLDQSFKTPIDLTLQPDIPPKVRTLFDQYLQVSKMFYTTISQMSQDVQQRPRSSSRTAVNFSKPFVQSLLTAKEIVTNSFTGLSSHKNDKTKEKLFLHVQEKNVSQSASHTSLKTNPPVVSKGVKPSPVVTTAVMPPSLFSTAVTGPPLINAAAISQSVVSSAVVPPPVVGVAVMLPFVVNMAAVPPVVSTVMPSQVGGVAIMPPSVLGTGVLPPPVVSTSIMSSTVVSSAVIPPPVNNIAAKPLPVVSMADMHDPVDSSTDTFSPNVSSAASSHDHSTAVVPLSVVSSAVTPSLVASTAVKPLPIVSSTVMTPLVAGTAIMPQPIVRPAIASPPFISSAVASPRSIVAALHGLPLIPGTAAQRKMDSVEPAVKSVDHAILENPPSNTRQFETENRFRFPHIKLDMEGDYQCVYCLKYFTTTFGRRLHVRKVHPGKPRPPALPRCDICKEEFQTRNELQAHRDKENHRAWKTKQLQCKQCGEYLTKKRFLKCHDMIPHTEKDKFPCDICGMVFKKARAAVSHKQQPHDEMSSTCDICGKKFSELKLMRSHRMRHNEENKKHMCEQCGKSFFTASKLKFHKKNHTEEKPYKCRFCDYATKWQTNIKKHERTHGKTSLEEEMQQDLMKMLSGVSSVKDTDPSGYSRGDLSEKLSGAS